MLLRCLSFCLLMLLAVGPAAAQFQLKSWDNYEQGTIPTSHMFLHDASSANVKVVEYANIPDPELSSPAARAEVGRFGLEFTTSASKRFLALVAQTMLDRQRLGENTRALFQADFYIKGEAQSGHTMAVVALGTDGLPAPLKAGQKHWTLYRFGCIGNDRSFFSYTNASATPTIYLHEKLTPPPRGWHRFQLVIEGNKSIACYLDGKLTGFSPLDEPSLHALQPGIMVTAPADKPMVVYVDNLSIQWTTDPKAPMPQSPWTLVSEPASTTNGVEWFRNPDDAFTASRQSGKPMMILFYTPGNAAFQELNNNLFASNEAFLTKVTPVRIDVNQLRGGQLATDFKVVQLPSVILLDGAMNEKGRVTMAADEKWAALRPKLIELMPK